MWSSHASVLRKYVTFHLRDAGRCKAAASLQLEGRGATACAKLQTSDLEGLLSWSSVLWDSRIRMSSRVTTLVTLDEIHLTSFKKMWLDSNECGSVLCMQQTPFCVTAFIYLLIDWLIHYFNYQWMLSVLFPCQTLQKQLLNMLSLYGCDLFRQHIWCSKSPYLA